MNALAVFPTFPRLDDILTRQRTAFLRDGAPTLAARRADLKKLRAAVTSVSAHIPARIDQDPSAHERRPMDRMRQGWSMRSFQAAQQWATMSS